MFLIRQPAKAKSCAHFWTGTDTACRLWSTGGLKARSQYRVVKERGRLPICSMCAGARPDFDAGGALLDDPDMVYDRSTGFRTPDGRAVIGTFMFAAERLGIAFIDGINADGSPRHNGASEWLYGVEPTRAAPREPIYVSALSARRGKGWRFHELVRVN
jgi:hypothetical protein